MPRLAAHDAIWLNRPQLARWPDPAALIWLAALVAVIGCTPSQYRRKADQETYSVIAEKTDDIRWAAPRVQVEPAPGSRLAHPFDPDRLPMPPDDPAAHTAMHHPGGRKGYRKWHEAGDAPWIENPAWCDGLPLSDAGELELSRDVAIELALVNSRRNQFEVETLYLSALALTLERFEFQLQWFGGNLTEYFHFGRSSTPNETNTLTTISDLGFTRALAAGGQLIVDLANSYVWEFTGANSVSVTSNLAVDFVQPLLRGAGRDIRMESLTQAERNVLYAARDFARFRKQFYFDVVAGAGGYLSLLLQLQTIRNLETNLSSLEYDLRAHEALFAAGIVSRIQVDQVFQSYQTGRFVLIQARNDYESLLDEYKILLGLPPDLPVEVDDSLLAPFQLTDPALNLLESEMETFLARYRELSAAPPLDDLREGFDKLNPFRARLAGIYRQVRGELERWKSRDEAAEQRDDQLGRERQVAAQQQIGQRLEELSKELEGLAEDVAGEAEKLNEENRGESWHVLQGLSRRHLAVVSQLFVLQTQIRAYLVQLRPVKYEEETAVPLALARRLDLMNQQARVVDQWRKVRLAQNALKADLDVVVGADIGTTPGSANPVKFSAAGTSYRAGFRFDSPLNRKAERNIYRAQLIQYERGRRSYMELKDRVVQAVRQDLRDLDANRLNFEIARQSLIIAASQVEFARDQLLDPEAAGDSSRTQDTLDALNSLLAAKNNLISIWIDYETNRLQLLLNIEALQLDPSQEPIDEYDHPTDRSPDVEELPAPAGIDDTGARSAIPDQEAAAVSLQMDAHPGGRRSSRRTHRPAEASELVRGE